MERAAMVGRGPVRKDHGHSQIQDGCRLSRDAAYRRSRVGPGQATGVEQRDSAQSNHHITSLRLSFPSSHFAANA